eukprot:2188645-Lingulodinium_polyedra.AAC.1
MVMMVMMVMMVVMTWSSCTVQRPHEPSSGARSGSGSGRPGRGCAWLRRAPAPVRLPAPRT